MSAVVVSSCQGVRGSLEDLYDCMIISVASQERYVFFAVTEAL